jgi:inner membrane protein
MDPLTHVATGVICSQLVSTPSRWWASVAGIIFALLPDVDYLFIYWDRLAFIRYHRGFTHSLIAVPLFALAGALVGRFLGGPRWFKPLLVLGLVVLSTHLLLDLATSFGTQLLSPFFRKRFALDWIFIIDPYFTVVLLAGAIAALAFPFWGPRVGGVALAAVAVYLLVCASYHHQALNLARQVFQNNTPGGLTVAALPQPLSCRRWHLIAAGPGKIRQAFVQLPYEAALGLGAEEGQVRDSPVSMSQACRAPATPYQDPRHLIIQTWTPASPATTAYSPEARHILASYLEFARFPFLRRAQSQGGTQLLEWLDLRFSVPGRAFPFVLQLRLDAQGRLQHWLIGHRSRGPH